MVDVWWMCGGCVVDVWWMCGGYVVDGGAEVEAEVEGSWITSCFKPMRFRLSSDVNDATKFFYSSASKSITQKDYPKVCLVVCVPYIFARMMSRILTCYASLEILGR